MEKRRTKSVPKWDTIEKGLNYQNKKFFQLSIFAFFALTLMLTAFAFNNQTNVTGNPTAIDSGTSASATDNQVVQFTFNLFKIDPTKWAASSDNVQKFFNNTGAVQIIIIHVMVFLILFFTFAYIFGIFLFFEAGSKGKAFKAIPWVVAAALAVIISLLGGVSGIVIKIAGALGVAGSAGIFIAMGIAIAFFVIETFLRNKLRYFKVKRAVEDIKAGGKKIGAGIGSLAEATKEFKNAGESI